MVHKVNSLKGVVSCLTSMVDYDFFQWNKRNIMYKIVP